jgi:predicted phosphate transport protein (TIGR00153 family)
MYPTETTLRLKRQLLQTCQELARYAVDSVREVHNLVVACLDGDASKLDEALTNISTLKNKSVETERTLANELVEAGAIMTSREDFLRLAAPLTGIPDLCEGIVFRLREFFLRKKPVEKGLREGFKELVVKTLETVMRLREVIFTLGFETSKIQEYARNVEAYEKEIDSLFRALEIKIIFSRADVSTILLLKDVANLIEEVADRAADAADAARILALSVF